MFGLLDYQMADGRDPFKEWLAELADRQARARVAVRVQRMAAGNFGDHKPLSDAV
jgi:putative addiction module killer protein